MYSYRYTTHTHTQTREATCNDDVTLEFSLNIFFFCKRGPFTSKVLN